MAKDEEDKISYKLRKLPKFMKYFQSKYFQKFMRAISLKISISI